MRFSKLNIGFVFSAMMFVSAAAQAADAKVYPGQSCVPSGNTAAYFISSNGGIFNSSTTATLTVFCPIIKDDTAATTINGFSVIVTDKSVNEGVSCTLVSRTQTAQLNGLTASTNGPDSLTTNLGTGAQTVLADSSLFLRCTVPKVNASQSGIVSYRVSELQ